MYLYTYVIASRNYVPLPINFDTVRINFCTNTTKHHHIDMYHIRTKFQISIWKRFQK